jgi:hypothetical protein
LAEHVWFWFWFWFRIIASVANSMTEVNTKASQ